MNPSTCFLICLSVILFAQGCSITTAGCNHQTENTLQEREDGVYRCQKSLTSPVTQKFDFVFSGACPEGFLADFSEDNQAYRCLSADRSVLSLDPKFQSLFCKSGEDTRYEVECSGEKQMVTELSCPDQLMSDNFDPQSCPS